MKTWFICTVKYQKEDEQGKVQKISESYLVDAMSFTEVETRIYEELESIIRGEFVISHINKSNFADVFYFEDADMWFKCKVTYMVADEKSGKEKKVINYMLVTAQNVKQAYERIEQSLSTMLVPFQIPSISETSFVEVFNYVSEKERVPKNLVPLSSVSSDN